jgi:adenylate cyclase
VTQRPSRLLRAYCAKVMFAYLVAVAEILAIVVALQGQISALGRTRFTESEAVTAAVLVMLGAFAVGVAAVINFAPTLRWFGYGRQPDRRQRRAATRILHRQSGILAAAWIAVGAAFACLNLNSGLGLAVPVGLAAVFAATSSVGIGVILTQRAYRPILAAAIGHHRDQFITPSVLTRLIAMWLVCSAVPNTVIAALIFAQQSFTGIPATTSVEIVVLVLSTATLLLGVLAMILVARSISDPLREVVSAMRDIKEGDMSTTVDVYERSEIGALQEGFNAMVGGLVERDRARDLFGRHVGIDVARQALDGGAELSGEVRFAAVLFIDLVGSTQLAANRPPEEVAEVLNAFFRTVVDAVDQGGGLINKFQGDAALAVFGAPLAMDAAASAALRTARQLETRLHDLSSVDFGVGVSAGHVFAGNIGAENRYEYTVIGDAVNEAARIADLAKSSDARILASSAATYDADPDERVRWAAHGSTTLRGRNEPTHLMAPQTTDAGSPPAAYGGFDRASPFSS